MPPIKFGWSECLLMARSMSAGGRGISGYWVAAERELKRRQTARSRAIFDPDLSSPNAGEANGFQMYMEMPMAFSKRYSR